MLTFGTHGANLPTTKEGKVRARWRAWWLPLGDDRHPNPPHYRSNKDIVKLIEELTEDHVK